jgi:hypothetical protein
MRSGSTPNFLAYAFGIQDLVRSPMHLHHAVTANALGQILIDRPDANFLCPSIFGRDPRSRRERIIGLELDHRPDGDTHRREGVLQRMELGE